MAVLINNIQKPKSCSDCQFESDYFGIPRCMIEPGCSYDKCPLIEINKEPDTNDGKSIVDLYKQVAFLAHLLRENVCCRSINSNDMQALDNIIDDLPEVTGYDFRW